MRLMALDESWDIVMLVLFMGFGAFPVVLFVTAFYVESLIMSLNYLHLLKF